MYPNRLFTKISFDGAFVIQTPGWERGFFVRDADKKLVVARDVPLSHISAMMVQSRLA